MDRFKEWYLYRHIRQDKNLPFYVGIGCTKDYSRAFSTKSRNKRWRSITKSTEYSVEIIFDYLNKENAILKEKEFIILYGRENCGGILCNQTDGGEGLVGRENVEEWKRKLSDKAKCMTEAHKKKISESKIGKVGGMLGKRLTQEQKDKISIKLKGKTKSEEHKKSLRDINLGKKQSEETINKKREWAKNIGHSDEAKQKMSKAASYKRSDETRKKMSMARVLYFQNKNIS